MPGTPSRAPREQHRETQKEANRPAHARREEQWAAAGNRSTQCDSARADLPDAGNEPGRGSDLTGHRVRLEKRKHWTWASATRCAQTARTAGGAAGRESSSSCVSHGDNWRLKISIQAAVDGVASSNPRRSYPTMHLNSIGGLTPGSPTLGVSATHLFLCRTQGTPKLASDARTKLLSSV